MAKKYDKLKGFVDDRIETLKTIGGIYERDIITLSLKIEDTQSKINNLGSTAAHLTRSPAYLEASPLVDKELSSFEFMVNGVAQKASLGGIKFERARLDRELHILKEDKEKLQRHLKITNVLIDELVYVIDKGA